MPFYVCTQLPQRMQQTHKPKLAKSIFQQALQESYYIEQLFNF